MGMRRLRREDGFAYRSACLAAIAAAVGATGVALSVSTSYYATKHRSLVDKGSGWTIVDDLTMIPERPTGTGFDKARLAEIRAAKAALAATIYPRPEPVGQLAAPASRTTTSRVYPSWTPTNGGRA
jgi:hypothetical protein